MEQVTCLTANCTGRPTARGLCGPCYNRGWRDGFPESALPKPRHHLSDIDVVNRIATCVVCGPTKIHIRKHGRSHECLTVRNANRGAGGTSEVRRRARLKTYGLTPEQYAGMYAAVGGACEICGASFPVLCVDHDHETGAVRGLLCSRCNQGLGHFLDDPSRIAAAGGYLRRTKAGVSL